MTTPTEPASIEIFRAGRHVATSGETLSFSEADLAVSAGAYDPALHEAPLVVGHPAADAPAYGWVQALSVEAARLAAVPHQLDPAFAEMVRAGRFKKISASFYRPDAPGNPKPGVYYLRHVGFLGAQPPAVKGLKPVQFADGDPGTVTLEFAERDLIHAQGWMVRLLRSLRDYLIEREGQEKADKIIEPWLLDESAAVLARAEAEATSPGGIAYAEASDPRSRTKKEADMSHEDAARRAELDQREADLKAKAAEFAEKDLRLRRTENQTFVAALVKDGKLLPVQTAQALAFMDRLDADTAVEFGEGEAKALKTPLAAFKEFLSALPKAVSFGELAKAAGGAVPLDDPQAIARAAVAFAEERRAEGIDITIDQAVRRVVQPES